MKKNRLIILFISSTILLLILGLFYLSQNYTCKRVVESFVSNSVADIPYKSPLITDENKKYTRFNNQYQLYTESIFNTEVKNSHAPIVYDVNDTDVNKCYGNGSYSIYTFPYIILVLRAQYLYSNKSNATQDELDDILNVLLPNETNIENRKGFILNESKFIVDNQNNNWELNKKTGTLLVKACSRIYPNWLMNPTSTSSTQINMPANILVNSASFVPKNNPNSILYVNPNKTAPDKSIIKLKTVPNTNPIPEILLPQSTSTNPPSTSKTSAFHLGQGIPSIGKMYVMDEDIFTNKNTPLNQDYVKNAPYCSKEWTNEFALANNINSYIKNNDICLQLLLNPITGDVIQCRLKIFNPKNDTLQFYDAYTNGDVFPAHVYANMVSLLKTSVDNQPTTFGIAPNKFGNMPKIDKYVFDNCGRLYSVPTGNKSFKSFPNGFDITHIWPYLAKHISDTSNFLSGKPQPGYNVLSSNDLSQIAIELIDELKSLPQIFHDIIKEEFSYNKYPSHAYLNTTNSSFTTYFKNADFSNIIDYTSSDGFIYINLGQIPDTLSLDIENNINSKICKVILKGMQGMLVKQITANTVIIKENTTYLQYMQAYIYQKMNNIVTLISSVFKNASLKIPSLNEQQSDALKHIAKTRGNVTCEDPTYSIGQGLAIDTLFNNTGTGRINIDPRNYLFYNSDRNFNITRIFSDLLKSTTANAASIYTPNNMKILQNCVGLFMSTNINFACDSINLIIDSLYSLILYKYKCLLNNYRDIQYGTSDVIHYNDRLVYYNWLVWIQTWVLNFHGYNEYKNNNSAPAPNNNINSIVTNTSIPTENATQNPQDMGKSYTAAMSGNSQTSLNENRTVKNITTSVSQLTTEQSYKDTLIDLGKNTSYYMNIDT